MVVAVVIPSYKVKKHILGLIPEIGSEVQRIIVVDDCCPEQSGKFVEENCQDPRVTVLYHKENQGVGGAVKTGYQYAVDHEIDLMVKLDGDGQMDPKLISKFITPILNGDADYTKGNRFYFLESLSRMPGIRLFGNSALSFINKMVNGYWNVMDPTNGYTAVHRAALERLPLPKIANRYFFESDMLFRLGTIGAVVQDVPMHAKYEDEESGLSVRKVLFEFPPKYINRFNKRIFYNYFLRDFNLGSIHLTLGLMLTFFGIALGGYFWVKNSLEEVYTSSGSVMLSALPIILGVQMLLFFLNYDVQSIPKKPLLKKGGFTRS